MTFKALKIMSNRILKLMLSKINLSLNLSNINKVFNRLLNIKYNLSTLKKTNKKTFPSKINLTKIKFNSVKFQKMILLPKLLKVLKLEKLFGVLNSSTPFLKVRVTKIQSPNRQIYLIRVIIF